MRITKITLRNFRAFYGEHIFETNGNIVFLVGENNTGKSTIFKAIDFLSNGPEGGTKNNRSEALDKVRSKTAAATDSVEVEAVIKGSISNVIDEFSDEKYSKYIYQEAGEETIRILRSSKNEEYGNGKDLHKMTIENIRVWNEHEKRFENPSGPDDVFKNLFSPQFIWADTHLDEVADFGTTKICGKLLGNIFKSFRKSPTWVAFQDAHTKTFHNGKDSLGEQAKELEEKIRTTLSENYGAINEVSFKFNPPSTDSYFKDANILVDDGIKTAIEEKGSGMQRSMVLALLQIYADKLAEHPDAEDKKRPQLFFIDEPEISLHPRGIENLMKALKKISKDQQIFITTHSDYLLRWFGQKKDQLLIFSRKGSTSISHKVAGNLDLFPWSPSWGEITFKAFGVATRELHDELFGEIQCRTGKWENKEMDDYLGIKLKKDCSWIQEVKGTSKPPFNCTLPLYIRNHIHHPENKQNKEFSDSDLHTSIIALIDILSTLPPKQESND